jgi:peptide chain release factor subunit 1
LVAAELAAATNIKDRLNRHAVADSLTQIKHALTALREVPENGLAIFSGGGCLELVAPANPLRVSLYRCDRRFHVDEVVAANAAGGRPMGVVVLDGDGVLVGVCDGTRRTVLARLAVELPSKHGRGGQSALRFSRLAEEARANYISKARELVVRALTREGVPRVAAVVLGGVGELKHRLADALPAPLRERVVATLDLAYGGQEGFARCCVECETHVGGARLTREREAVAALETSIAVSGSGSGDLYALGAARATEALAAGCAHAVLIDKAHVLRGELEAAAARSGASVCLISNATPEGARFCAGLTGVAVLLRWPLVFTDVDNQDNAKDDALDTKNEPPQTDLDLAYDLF